MEKFKDRLILRYDIFFTEEEIAQILKMCLERGRPYSVDELSEKLMSKKLSLYDLADLYKEKFGELFQTWGINFSEEDLIEIYRECLKTGKPYEFDAETKKLLENPDVDF